MKPKPARIMVDDPTGCADLISYGNCDRATRRKEGAEHNKKTSDVVEYEGEAVREATDLRGDMVRHNAVFSLATHTAYSFQRVFSCKKIDLLLLNTRSKSYICMGMDGLPGCGRGTCSCR